MTDTIQIAPYTYTCTGCGAQFHGFTEARARNDFHQHVQAKHPRALVVVIPPTADGTK
ncbi:hypothetical protein [Xylanimonas protaetiae]|uniref:hypothetical protein n=1 Tax=Xylanimonas protaetiae TaxID=2509457 RepID=UPI0013EBA284|nr:hypothetical protein [Xylanimonas protaetiae]